MELNEYQRQANQTDPQSGKGNLETDPHSILAPLFGMADEVGKLQREYNTWLRDGDSYQLYLERVKEGLGDLLRHLSNVASWHGLDLEDVAKFNICKIQRLRHYPVGEVLQLRLPDASFPAKERFPRQMDVHINDDGSKTVVMLIDGIQIGDPLRDNRSEDDGYRFHDIFHLSYASVLGWSPTLRALMRLKRKSDPDVDEWQDGGRARVLEEGISAKVFSYAERRNFLEGVQSLDYNLLREIKEMTSHLEVSARTEGEWERAILTGFDIWRQVKAKGRGRIHADLEQGTIELVG